MVQGWTGRPKKRAREACFRRWGTHCHICGHAGAYEVDHLAERKHGGASYDVANLRPVHGSSAPCPVCVGSRTGRPRCCNQERNRKPGSVVRGVPIEVDLGSV